MQHRTLRVDGIETHFLEAGEGPDLVLLHGGEYGASAEATWGPAMARLAERFRVVAPDMPGYGRTDKIYSFSDPSGFRMAHLAALLKVLDVGDAFFVGNSAGGGVLLRSAVREPPPLRMKKMVTVCGNAGIFKSASQADLEDYTPSPENMRKLLGLLFHDPKWLTPETVEKRYADSVLPGHWEALSAARLRPPGARRGAPPTSSCGGCLRWKCRCSSCPATTTPSTNRTGTSASIASCRDPGCTGSGIRPTNRRSKSWTRSWRWSPTSCCLDFEAAGDYLRNRCSHGHLRSHM